MRKIVSYSCGACGKYNRHTEACSYCGVEPSFNRAPWDGVQIGFIDGPSNGFFPSAMGFPNAGDPKHPTLKTCPSKRAWKNAAKDRYENLA